MEKELTFDELKQIELQLLCEFAKICDKLELRYSLGGGTLLGAVRHKGFIPWDDDIDVMLPRKDYDALIEYTLNNELPFDLISYETDKTYMRPYAIIVDRNTITYDVLNGKRYKRRGVSIDVFPLDGLADTKKEALKVFKKTSISRELLIARQWERFFRSKTHSWYIEPVRFGMFILSRFFKAEWLLTHIDNFNKKHDFDSNNYVACICGDYREKEIMQKKEMNEYISLEFEQYKFKCIVGYKQYLKQHYGNYMELPPKEKQVSHHLFKAYKISE